MFKVTGAQRQFAGQRGFSLVEMIIVMAILGVVIMAVMSLFIPAVRSTNVQSGLSDVQANLRLAMNRLTEDLLVAGYLVNPGYSNAALPGGSRAGAIYWTSDVVEDPTELTIRTRTVGNAFARVVDNEGSNLAVSDADMLSAFPVGTKIRIFAPVDALEIQASEVAGYDENNPAYYASCVYTVTASSTPITVNTTSYPGGGLTVSGLLGTPPPGTLREAVIVKIRDDTQPPMQTIRYRVNNGALERIVNGSVQILARNVQSANFDYVNSASGAVKRVDVTLTGEPVGLTGGGAESTAKNRSLRTSVALRNVY